MDRETQRAEMRKRILTAALEEFGTCGFRGASTNRICKTADISKGLLFHYYETKEKLFFAVMDQCMEEMEKGIEQNIQGTIGRIKTATEKYSLVYVEEFYQIQLKFFSQHPYHYRVISEIFNHRLTDLQDGLEIRKEQLHRRKKGLLCDFLEQLPLREEVNKTAALKLMAMASDQMQQRYLTTVLSGKMDIHTGCRRFAEDYLQIFELIIHGITKTEAFAEAGVKTAGGKDGKTL